jgi:signal transduction histidine kinase
VLLALHGRDRTELLGYAQYYVDARSLSAELALTDQRIDRQTIATLAIGATLIAGVFLVAYFRLRRADRQIAKRNEELIRTSFELTLAAKASALGQITSHLVHGLQGPVAGLRTMIATANRGPTDSDWKVASDYAEQMQAIIHESVTLLGDTASQTTYDLDGNELAAVVKTRNSAAAEKKGVLFVVTGSFNTSVNNHCGGILCLITSNLIQNAIEATDAGRTVQVDFANDGGSPVIVVSDEGSGIPENLRAHLFEPGRSTRTHGTGLGLAISQLLARQINAAIALASTGPEGTVFRITVGT